MLTGEEKTSGKTLKELQLAFGPSVHSIFPLLRVLFNLYATKLICSFKERTKVGKKQ